MPVPPANNLFRVPEIRNSAQDKFFQAAAQCFLKDLCELGIRDIYLKMAEPTCSPRFSPSSKYESIEFSTQLVRAILRFQFKNSWKKEMNEILYAKNAPKNKILFWWLGKPMVGRPELKQSITCPIDFILKLY